MPAISHQTLSKTSFGQVCLRFAKTCKKPTSFTMFTVNNYGKPSVYENTCVIEGFLISNEVILYGLVFIGLKEFYSSFLYHQ